MAEKKQPTDDIRIEDDAKLLADTLDDILCYSGDSADEAYITLKKMRKMPYWKLNQD